jgi:hypothetical protein
MAPTPDVDTPLRDRPRTHDELLADLEMLEPAMRDLTRTVESLERRLIAQEAWARTTYDWLMRLAQLKIPDQGEVRE